MKPAICLVFVIAIVAGGFWYHSESRAATAEREAMEFVRLSGYTNEGYSHTFVSGVIFRFAGTIGWKPIGSRILRGVGIPEDRMTDNMATQLVQIRNLNSIALHPENPNGHGIDFGATAFTTVKSLRELDLPLSSNSMTMIEKRYPNVRIQIAQSPPAALPASPNGK